MRVIDVGSGTGFAALLAAELGHDVAAVDWSEGMQDTAREKALAAGLTIQFVLGRAEDLPCPDSSAGAVVARHVLWTLLDPVAALREWRRVLRPGGAVLADMSLSADRGAHYSPQVERSLPLHQVTGPDIVLGMFAAAGFADATVELVDHYTHQHGASGLFRAVK
jgi:ubiquinone/menaquinone biosynthesis C-methylase UbiE